MTVALSLNTTMKRTPLPAKAQLELVSFLSIIKESSSIIALTRLHINRMVRKWAGVLLIMFTRVGDGDIAPTNAWKHMMEDAKLHH